MAGLSISKAWDETREVLSRDGRLMLPPVLALLVLPQTLVGAFAPVTPNQIGVEFKVLLIVAIFTAIAAQITLNRLAIPPSETVGAAIIRGLQRVPAAFVALFLVFLVTFVFLVLLLLLLISVGVMEQPASGRPPSIPLVILLLVCFVGIFAIFQLTIPVAAAERGGPFRIINRSRLLAKGHYWRLAGFLVLASVGMIIFWLSAQVVAGVTISAIFGPPASGSIGQALISLLVALVQAAWTVVTSVMLARIYVQLSGQGALDVSVPKSGT